MTYGDPQNMFGGAGGSGAIVSGSIYATNSNLSNTITIRAGDLVLEEGQECLADRLNRVEKCLGIVPRQTSLEERYPDLKQLGDQIDQAVSEIQRSHYEMISKVVGEYNDFVKECEIMEKLSTDGNP